MVERLGFSSNDEQQEKRFSQNKRCSSEDQREGRYIFFGYSILTGEDNKNNERTGEDMHPDFYLGILHEKTERLKKVADSLSLRLYKENIRPSHETREAFELIKEIRQSVRDLCEM